MNDFQIRFLERAFYESNNIEGLLLFTLGGGRIWSIVEVTF